MFAVQYAQECFSGPDAADTYQKYGASDRCNDQGTGGTWAQHVYRIKTDEGTGFVIILGDYLKVLLAISLDLLKLLKY